MSWTDLLATASVEELKRGYIEQNEILTCLFCGTSAETGIVYAEDGVFYEARKFMQRHIEASHASPFGALIALGKKATGLTDHQNALLRLFYAHKSDTQIKDELGIGSASTIRNHRFALKEKERQARIFLALMELLKEQDTRAPAVIDPHPQARLVDDRYNMTAEEEAAIVRRVFPDGPDGPLKTFDLREKQRLAALQQIARRFGDGILYSEKEVNAKLQPIYADYAILRRFLIEYGFLDREPDGSAYWTTRGGRPTAERKRDSNPNPQQEDLPVNRKKELQQMYKEIKPEAGVYRIVHTRSGKCYVAALPNLKSISGRRFELNNGSFRNSGLQQDWNEYGEDAFEFEVLEVLEPSENVYVTLKEQLAELESRWLAELRPYGERGYNRPPSQ